MSKHQSEKTCLISLIHCFSPSSLGNQQTQQPREGGDLGLVTTYLAGDLAQLPHFSMYSRFPEQGQDFSQVNRNALLELVPSELSDLNPRWLHFPLSSWLLLHAWDPVSLS